MKPYTLNSVGSVTPVAIAFVVSLISSTLAADETPVSDGVHADTSRWLCSLCPYRYGWYGRLDFGGLYVSDSSPKFGDYRGLERDGGYLALDGDAHYRDRQGRFVDIKARTLALDSRYLDMRGGQRGRYTLNLGYREIPKYRGFGTQSAHRGVGGDQLSLPDGWQTAQTTSGMTLLAGSLRPVELKTLRKTLDTGLKWKAGRRWSYEVEFEHQRKDGTRPFGAGVFQINSSHFPAPVDYSTNRLDLGVNYRGDRSHWRLGFSGSSFDNGHASITWQNPFTPIPGTEFLSASLEPDNRFYQFNLTGAWAPRPGFRLSGKAALGQMQQDDPFLPYSINPNFSDIPLPRLNADTRIDTGTLNLAGKLTARLSRRLDITARLRRDKRDNESAVDLYTPVITDLLQREPRPNRPYSFERDRASVSLRYRALSHIRLQAGADFEDYERSLQSVLVTSEHFYWGEFSLSAGSMVDIRARLERSRRDASPYRQVDELGLIEHPLMRKFHLADRDRDRLKIDLEFMPLTELAFSLSYYTSKDDYRKSQLGLQESEESNINLDIDWAVSDRVNVYAFFSHDDIDSRLSGAEFVQATPWRAITDDRFVTAGVGLSAKLSQRFSFGFDFVTSDSDGDILTDTGAGEAHFPTVETELRNARLHVDFDTGGHWGVKLYVEHEKYDSSDWAIDGMGADGIASILTFGALSPDYSVTLIRLQGVYRY